MRRKSTTFEVKQSIFFSADTTVNIFYKSVNSLKKKKKCVINRLIRFKKSNLQITMEAIFHRINSSILII